MAGMLGAGACVCKGMHTERRGERAGARGSKQAARFLKSRILPNSWEQGPRPLGAFS